MMNTQKATRYLFYSVWAVLMTALTYILGAVSLKLLRRRFGRSGYWALSTVMSAGLYAMQFKILGVAFFSLVVLIGVFSELEEMEFSFGVSVFFTLVINTLLAAGSFALWVYSAGAKWSNTIVLYLENMFKPLVQMNPQLEINYFEMMLVLPSIILILWMGAIYVSILLESRVRGRSEAANQQPLLMRQQLGDIRLPDLAVWIFILSLLGTFAGLEVKWIEVVSANVLNVCLMLFFFQGVAVMARFFDSLKITAFWQTLFMLLMVVYLFLFVSLIGLADYWVDFRARLAKRTEEFNRET